MGCLKTRGLYIICTAKGKGGRRSGTKIHFHLFITHSKLLLHFTWNKNKILVCYYWKAHFNLEKRPQFRVLRAHVKWNSSACLRLCSRDLYYLILQCPLLFPKWDRIQPLPLPTNNLPLFLKSYSFFPGSRAISVKPLLTYFPNILLDMKLHDL